MKIWPNYYHGPKQAVRVLRRNPLRLFIDGSFIGQYASIDRCLLRAQYYSDQNDFTGICQIRVGSALYVEFEIMPRADAIVFFSSNQPAFARPAGARAFAQASAVSAGSTGALDANANISGSAILSYPGSVSNVGAPTAYNDLVTELITMAQQSANNLAAGNTTWLMSEYNNTSVRSTFYGLGESLRSFKIWAAANGYSHTSVDAGRDRATAAYINMWGRSFGNYAGNVIFASPEVPYYALQDGTGGGDITVVEQDVENETLHFNFEHNNRFRIGAFDDPTNVFYGHYTARSRPIANKAKAFIYREKQGLGEYNQPIYGGYMLPYMEEAMVNHCYRWRNEFQNYGSNIPDPGDRTAPFMIAKTLDTMALLYDHRISRGQSPNLYFPTTVKTGDLGVGAGIQDTANPYTDYLDCMTDILLWLGRPVEGSLTLDTTPYSGLGHAAEYCRLVEDGGGRSLGDPMLELASGLHGEYVVVLYRNGSNEVYPADNIQMMNVHAYYWLARKLSGTDNVTRDRLIRMGNAILYGAVLRMQAGITNQKPKNQTMEGIFKALNEYSLMTGTQY